MENVRSRCYALILYKDSIDYDYNKVIEYIEQNVSKYAYIEHKPEKEETKAHTHVLLYFNNKKYLSSLSNELGVSANYIQTAQLKPYLKYLIHYDNDDKIQYTLNDVCGPLRFELEELITDKSSECEDFVLLYDYIVTYDGILSFTTFTKYAIKNNMYSTYRRNINSFRILINEHNGSY